jgi:group II intron reverse transcriptase/maturase
LIISETQSKLAKWSTEDKTRKFDRLLRLIASRDWLQEAANRTLQSSGAKTPGIDGIDKAAFAAEYDANIETIRAELLSGTYEPLPARRVYIPKANGNLRPLGIPTLKDRVIQRAMLMAMEPIWESDFHRDSYGFRPARSVHHSIRAVKLILQDGGEQTSGRWIIEGDLTSYFDTVYHRLLMRCVRKRIKDKRFLDLLWKLLKAGCVDKNLFCAAHEGVPQGGVLSPLLSNIMLNEFDQWLEQRYLCKKARKDRWYWNFSLKRPISAKEGRTWLPAVAYSRYADDFVLIVKGTKQQAEVIREECRQFLETDLKLQLNLEKTALTHVNDGFTFLGHRVIRKRGPKGTMRTVSQIPREKFQKFAAKIIMELSNNYDVDKLKMVERLNRKIRGWSNFYQFTDFTAVMFCKMDRIIFWKLGYWLSRKYRTNLKEVIKRWVKYPKDRNAKTWIVYGKGHNGNGCGATLHRMLGAGKKQFRWKTPSENPYLAKVDPNKIFESRYSEVATAMS